MTASSPPCQGKRTQSPGTVGCDWVRWVQKAIVFASKCCVPNPSFSVATFPSHTQLFLDSVSLSPDKVESLLSNLDSDCATGPDGISQCILKTCSSVLAHPLSVLFTLSFAQSHLPSAWKSANITALHKNRSLQLQTNQPSPNHQQGYGLHHRFRH